MNEFTYDELYVNQEQSFKVKITKEDMDFFQKITKDENPLHIDHNYAKENNFKDNVVYGMLTASYLSTLAGVYIPGKNSLINSVNLFFVKPVYVGDTLLVKGKVTNKNDKFKIIRLKVDIYNQTDVKVLRGSMDIGVLR